MAARRGTHGLSGDGILRHLAVAILASACILTLEASPTAAAATACQVTNRDSGKTYVALQSAVDVAKPGAHLIVKGTCIGKTVVATRLVIEGVTTERFGTPMLTRYAKPLVLEVLPHGRVKLWDLVVLLGDTFDYSYPGIANEGNLVLRDVVVRRNRPCSAGNHAVVNHHGGFLSMRGSSSVSRIRCDDPLVESHNDLAIGGVLNYGTLVMHDASSIYGNRGRGLTNYGRVTMNDTSSIRANRVPFYTGNGAAGVWNGPRLGDGQGGVITMNDASTISDNSAPFAGGVENVGTFTMNDTSSIGGNRATSESDGGIGGIWNLGTLTMTGASFIVGNTAFTSPGGLSNGRSPGPIGTLTGVTCGPNGNVHGNTPDDCWPLP